MMISSKDNKHFKVFKKLTSIEGIRKSGKIIVSGRKLIKEIARAFANQCVSLILYERYAENDSEIEEIIKKFSDNKSVYILQKQLYNELDIFNTNDLLLVINTPEIPAWDYTLELGCNLLIPFQDPVNVGAVIRSAVGFGVQKLILLKESAHPFHPRSVRASSGAVFKVNLLRGPSIHELKKICDERSLEIIALDMAGTPAQSFQFPKKFLLLTGLEGQGIPDPLKKRSISIQIDKSIESLNAVIATSISLFIWQTKRKEYYYQNHQFPGN